MKNSLFYIVQKAVTESLYIGDTEPTDPYLFWFNTINQRLYIYENDTWSPAYAGIYVGNTQPDSNIYELWYSTQDGSLYVYDGSDWIAISGSANTTDSDEKVKASASDPVAGYLDSKVDNETIEVQNNKLSIKFQDDQIDNVVWSSNRITKEAIVKSIIFG